MENDLEIWEMAKNIWEISYLMHGAQLKYLRNGLTMLEMS